MSSDCSLRELFRASGTGHSIPRPAACGSRVPPSGHLRRKTPVPSLAGGKAPEAGSDEAIQILYFCNTKQTFYKGLVSRYNIDAFYRGTTDKEKSAKTNRHGICHRGGWFFTCYGRGLFLCDHLGVSQHQRAHALGVVADDGLTEVIGQGAVPVVLAAKAGHQADAAQL